MSCCMAQAQEDRHSLRLEALRAPGILHLRSRISLRKSSEAAEHDLLLIRNGPPNTLARVLPQSGAVQNVDPASAVLNRSLLLQFLGLFRPQTRICFGPQTRICSMIASP